VCKGHKRGVWCVKFSPVDKVPAPSRRPSSFYHPSADLVLLGWGVRVSAAERAGVAGGAGR
jgi:hypothetical protein